jgi:hypothetical protein
MTNKLVRLPEIDVDMIRILHEICLKGVMLMPMVQNTRMKAATLVLVRKKGMSQTFFFIEANRHCL